MHADEQPHQNQPECVEKIVAEAKVNKMTSHQSPGFGFQYRYTIVLQPRAATVTEKLEYAANNDQNCGKPPTGYTSQNCKARIITILV